MNNNYQECNCNNLTQKEMLHQIMSLNFAINDLALYLDTHPNDSCAIKKHNEYSEKATTLIKEYQNLFGPLFMNFSSDTWKWIGEPWPWERGAY